MNHGAELVELVESLEARVWVDGDRLELNTPTDFPDNLIEDLRRHKQAVITSLATERLPTGASRLLQRLRKGHQWLSETQLRLLDERDVYEGMEERFLYGIDLWDNMDSLLRQLYGYKGCVMGSVGRCPDDSPISCRGCAGRSSPAEEPES